MRAACRSILGCGHGSPFIGEYVVVDEGLIRCYTRLCAFIVRMKNKPIKKGLKLYMLVDHQTGLLVDFILHDGPME
jgi:hypothetical protein